MESFKTDSSSQAIPELQELAEKEYVTLSTL